MAESGARIAATVFSSKSGPPLSSVCQPYNLLRGIGLHSLQIEFNFGDDSRLVYESLKPELQAVPSERSKIGLELSGQQLILTIFAEDIISLRAAVNTWLRLVKISEEMLNVKRVI